MTFTQYFQTLNLIQLRTESQIDRKQTFIWVIRESRLTSEYMVRVVVGVTQIVANGVKLCLLLSVLEQNSFDCHHFTALVVSTVSKVVGLSTSWVAPLVSTHIHYSTDSSQVMVALTLVQNHVTSPMHSLLWLWLRLRPQLRRTLFV